MSLVFEMPGDHAPGESRLARGRVRSEATRKQPTLWRSPRRQERLDRGADARHSRLRLGDDALMREPEHVMTGALQAPLAACIEPYLGGMVTSVDFYDEADGRGVVSAIA